MMEKEYTFTLTDEEAMHILLAMDEWRSKQKENAHDAHRRELANADEYEERFLISDELVPKLLEAIVKANPEFDIKKMWNKIMFDI